MPKNLISKIKIGIKDSFTKDIGHQPFIDGFVEGGLRVQLGFMKVCAEAFKGRINPSHIIKYVEPLQDYYAKASKSDKNKFVAGLFSSIPLMGVTLLVGGCPALIVGSMGFAYNRTKAYLKGEKIEQEGLGLQEIYKFINEK